MADNETKAYENILIGRLTSPFSAETGYIGDK